ncbi:MAG: MFS transporter [Acidobacteriota bacterium]
MNRISTTRVTPRPSPVVALQYRDFRLIWIGQLISNAGTQMQLVTINWHVYVLTGSAVALGLTGLVRVVPIIIFSLFGGMFADAHDRRRVMLVTQSAMMLFAAVLGLATNSGWVSPLIIYGLAALTSAAVAFDGPARQSLAPNLVAKEHLTNALSLNNTMAQVSSIIGPALAGFVIAGLGIAAVYWINAVSFLAMLIALLLIKTPTQKQVGASKITLGALREGIQFVRESKMVFSTMMLDFFATFFSSASALLPIFARDILRVGPEGLGLLYSAQSVGAVAAGVGMAVVGNITRQGIVLLVAVALYGVATAFYGASQWFALSFIFLALLGAADTVSTILRNTIRQISTPDHLRGRMTSVNMIFFMGGPQLGNLEAGVVAALFGAPFSVITGGIATVIAVVAVAWLIPQLRNYQN